MQYFLSFSLLLFTATSYSQATDRSKPVGPVKVELRKNDSSFQLFRNGQPYFIKGAGGELYLNRIAAYGGNSIRTWGTTGAQEILDTASKYGLTVLLGLDVESERHGFNYDDTAAVQQQLRRLRAEVLKYKNHPALLVWGIGNELNLHYKNPKVWDAVNDISKMIHELDPNHPTSTILAGVNKKLVDYITERAPDIDILSINIYGTLATLPEKIEEADWKGAYMVTEWGPTGHWECLQTDWNSSIEETSSEKAMVYKSRYEYSIEKDKNKCLGSYVFLWGQKQERTPTWYGIFTATGAESEVVDVIQYIWSGEWPQNKSPHLYSLRVNNRKSNNNIYLKPFVTNTAKTVVADPDNDKLSYTWEILPEPTQLSTGGDFEASPEPVKGLITVHSAGTIEFKTPDKAGAYRLFVYVYDGHNNVATANVPFFVNK